MNSFSALILKVLIGNLELNDLQKWDSDNYYVTIHDFFGITT